MSRKSAFWAGATMQQAYFRTIPWILVFWKSAFLAGATMQQADFRTIPWILDLGKALFWLVQHCNRQILHDTFNFGWILFLKCWKVPMALEKWFLWLVQQRNMNQDLQWVIFGFDYKCLPFWKNSFYGWCNSATWIRIYIGLFLVLIKSSCGFGKIDFMGGATAQHESGFTLGHF